MTVKDCWKELTLRVAALAAFVCFMFYSDLVTINLHCVIYRSSLALLFYGPINFFPPILFSRRQQRLIDQPLLFCGAIFPEQTAQGGQTVVITVLLHLNHGINVCTLVFESHAT